MALKRSAANLPPEVLQKPVAPIQGKVGVVDPVALAAKVVARVVEKSEVCGGMPAGQHLARARLWMNINFVYICT